MDRAIADRVNVRQRSLTEFIDFYPVPACRTRRDQWLYGRNDPDADDNHVCG